MGYMQLFIYEITSKTTNNYPLHRCQSNILKLEKPSGIFVIPYEYVHDWVILFHLVIIEFTCKKSSFIFEYIIKTPFRNMGLMKVFTLATCSINSFSPLKPTVWWVRTRPWHLFQHLTSWLTLRWAITKHYGSILQWLWHSRTICLNRPPHKTKTCVLVPPRWKCLQSSAA